jgi:hypothetical protein
MRMGIGLGIGINRSNYAQGIFGAYESRVLADGGVTEAGGCVDAVSGLLLNASLLLIPSGYKSGKAYAEIPTNGNGDLTWTRASTATRTNSSGLLESMSSGVPRLSYMYGSCPALLLEPQRTNLMLQSESFDNASWSKADTSVTANTTTSPDGTTNADSLIENTATALHQISQGTAAAGGVYTATIYAKPNGRNWVFINIAAASNYGAWFDVQNGTVGTIQSNITSATITSVGNGWYSCSLTGNTIALNPRISLTMATSNGSLVYTGNGTSGVFLYGAQLELGAYPTTYIPTTTASATRVADSFSRDNIFTNGLITSSGGTWFVELRGNVALTRDAGVNFGLGIGDSAGTNAINIWNVAVAPTATRLQIRKNIASGGSATIYTTTADTVKLAIKWNGTSIDVFENGTKVVSASAFTITNMDFLRCSCEDRPRFIQAMGLHPTPLTDAQCIELTTL